MVRIRFEWNTWSTGPVTGCIIFAAWAVTAAIVGMLMSVFGASGPATFTLSLAKGMCAISIAILAFAMATGVILERAPSRIRRAKVQTRPASGPSAGFPR